MSDTAIDAAIKELGDKMDLKLNNLGGEVKDLGGKMNALAVLTAVFGLIFYIMFDVQQKTS